MKKLLLLLVVSVIGGAITLGTYKLFLEKEQKVVIESTNSQPVFMPTNVSTIKPSSAISQGIDFVEAAEKTVDAVVHVMNTTISRAPVTIQDLFFGRGTQRAQIGTGSGVIISPDGYIVTNNHVIDGAQSLSVTLNDNRTLSAELVGSDPRTDIALLKIESDEELPFTRFGDSDQAKVGEWVLAVGNPFNLTSTVTAGIISAKSRDLSGQNFQSFIQTDAAVNPGNSGGALVNTNGDLIGINTAITSQTGSYIGYSFAVPSNIARKVIEDIMEFGNVQNGILGVTGGALNSAYAKKLGLEETEGFYIDDVEEKSGASRAGLRSGDIIKKLDEVDISKFADLSGYLSSKRPNDVVNVTVLRRGNQKIVPVKLTKKGLEKVEFIGLELRNLSKEAKKKYDLEGGAYVFKTNNYELFKKLGLKNGYIITDINDIPINNIEDIQNFKNKIGNNSLEKSIDKMGVINTKGQRERFIFK
jgi:Do/DeqQ family serine protease